MMATVAAIAAIEPKRKSVMRNIAPIIATTSRAMPAIASRLAIRRRYSLTCWRHSSLWWADGAMSRPAENIVHMSVPKKTLLQLGHLRESRRERHHEQKREQHLHPRQRNAKLLEECCQLAVTPVLAVIAHRECRYPECVRVKRPCSGRVTDRP